MIGPVYNKMAGVSKVGRRGGCLSVAVPGLGRPWWLPPHAENFFTAARAEDAEVFFSCQFSALSAISAVKKPSRAATIRERKTFSPQRAQRTQRFFFLLSILCALGDLGGKKTIPRRDHQG
ncbi:MAG: hypothetical protein DDG58_14820, partial [Ardenticatenia bacterium]